jgi:multidrug transporter EmrE-like cation transporter
MWHNSAFLVATAGGIYIYSYHLVLKSYICMSLITEGVVNVRN